MTVSESPKTGDLVQLKRGDVLWEGLAYGVKVVGVFTVGIVFGREPVVRLVNKEPKGLAEGWEWVLLLIVGTGFIRWLRPTAESRAPVFFTPGVVLDQTYGYFETPHTTTTSHKNALVFSHAVHVFEYNFDFVEIVWDLEEFRSREDTW